MGRRSLKCFCSLLQCLSHPIGMFDIHNTIPLSLNLQYCFPVGLMTGREEGRGEGERDEKEENKEIEKKRKEREREKVTGLKLKLI